MAETHPIPEIPEQLEAELREHIAEWMPELRTILPELPEDLQVNFNNQSLISSTGTGGYASDSRNIDVAFDPNFDGDKEQQLVDFKASLFHESYHVVQGFLGEDSKYQGRPFIDNAILEGAATKFEVIRAGSNPGWSDYSEVDIESWLQEVLGMDYTSDGETWGKIKFYDPETDRQWVLYRVGCYVVDEALKNSGLEIEDLVLMDPTKILKLSKLLRTGLPETKD